MSDALNPTRRSAAVFSTATGAEEKAKLTPLFSSPGRLYRTNQLLANEFGQSGILDVGIGWPSDPTRELSSLVPGRVRAVDIFVPTQVLTPNPETFPYHSVIYALFDWRGRLIVRSNTGAELVGTEIPPAMREGLVSLKDRLLAQVRDVGVKKFSDADGNSIDLAPAAGQGFPLIEGDLRNLADFPAAEREIREAGAIRIANVLAPYFSAEEQEAVLRHLGGLMKRDAHLFVVLTNHDPNFQGEEAIEYLPTDRGLQVANLLFSVSFTRAAKGFYLKLGTGSSDSNFLGGRLGSMAWAALDSDLPLLTKLEEMSEGRIEVKDLRAVEEEVARSLAQRLGGSSRSGLVCLPILNLGQQGLTLHLPKSLLPGTPEEAGYALMNRLRSRVGREADFLLDSVCFYFEEDRLSALKLLDDASVQDLGQVPGRRLQSFWVNPRREDGTEPPTPGLPVYVEPGALPEGAVSRMRDRQWNLIPWDQLTPERLAELAQPGEGRLKAAIIARTESAERLSQTSLSARSPVLVVASEENDFLKLQAGAVLDYLVQAVRQAERLPDVMMYYRLYVVFSSQNLDWAVMISEQA